MQLRDGNKLVLNPVIPRGWPAFEVTHQRGASRWTIDVKNPDGVSRGVKSIRVDGVVVADPTAPVRVVDDGEPHRIEVVLGATPSASDSMLAPLA